MIALRAKASGSTIRHVRTLLPDPPPAEIEAFLERRRRAGADRHDEVWEGVLHVSPEPSAAHADVLNQLAVLLTPLARERGLAPVISPFNLGESEHDYRAPDGGLLWERSAAVWNPTAAMVIEVLSPGDETWEKLPFYAAHDVDEVLIVDPQKRSVGWLGREGHEYRQIEHSRLIELGAAELAKRIDWPPVVE